MMNHCAKKLLGLAFALALCLAVGGTALAQTPEFADVPDALPELEMLAYEPNVTTAEDVTTIDALAVGGYKVTIPTTVTVDSTQHTGWAGGKRTAEAVPYPEYQHCIAKRLEAAI